MLSSCYDKYRRGKIARPQGLTPGGTILCQVRGRLCLLLQRWKEGVKKRNKHHETKCVFNKTKTTKENTWQPNQENKISENFFAISEHADGF